jgi:hypothetical protein
VESLAYVLTSGWASGINVYATILVTGLLGRYGGVEGVPDVLERNAVLLPAAALFAIEFVADKIPYVVVLLVASASLGLFLIRRIRLFVRRLRGPPAPEPPPGRL